MPTTPWSNWVKIIIKVLFYLWSASLIIQAGRKELYLIAIDTSIWSRSRVYGGILVFWEPWQNHPVKCEEMKLSKTFDLNVKVKTDERKFWRIMTVKCEDEVPKGDKCEARLPQQDPRLYYHQSSSQSIAMPFLTNTKTFSSYNNSRYFTLKFD